MNWIRQRWVPLAALGVATGLLIASIAWVAGNTPGSPTGAAARPAIPGDGPVDDLTGAAQAAGRFAHRQGLEVGEVMQFANDFYVELVDPEGNGATEVLVDPASGAVQIEWGPAMMWNTAYGMHPGYGMPPGREPRAAIVGPLQARRIADVWLAENRPGERADQAKAFPGYYTLHTLRDDRVTGMLSVHAVSGTVWYHDWHGRFIRGQDHSVPRPRA